MKYIHNANDEQARAAHRRETRIIKAINVLGIIDLVLIGLVVFNLLLLAVIFPPCPRGGICVSHIFAGLAFYIFGFLMLPVAVGAGITMAVAKAKRVDLKSEYWKIFTMIGLGMVILGITLYILLT